MKKYKEKIRLINLLLHALRELKKAKVLVVVNKIEDFKFKCSQIIKCSDIFSTAAGKGWLDSAEKIRARVSRNLADFQHNLNQFKDTVSSDSIETRPPKFSDIFKDLTQIEQELGEYKFDLKERTISVTTDPVTLEDISLGSFEIRISIDKISKLYGDSPYSIIALEPNPASSDSNVTHPHVSSEKLCEGDGYVSIRKSLEQGRFYDFFTIIVNILQTYNPDSAYVSLEDWQGISCYDCGYTISGDDNYYCEYCENDFCSQCSTYCQICDTTVCLGCSYECTSCGKYICSHCKSVCSECDREFCKDCLSEGICEDCLEQINKLNDEEEQENEENNQQTQELQTSPEIQSDSLGEAAIHA